MAGLRFYRLGLSRTCGDDFWCLGALRWAGRFHGLRRRAKWAFLRIKANFAV